MNKLSLQQCNALLKHFGLQELTPMQDEVFGYSTPGYEVWEKEREYTWETIAGDRKETVTHWVLYEETVEYNYPHEPDYVDIEEVAAELSPLACVATLIRRDIDNRIEGFCTAMAEAELDQDVYS